MILDHKIWCPDTPEAGRVWILRFHGPRRYVAHIAAIRDWSFFGADDGALLDEDTAYGQAGLDRTEGGTAFGQLELETLPSVVDGPYLRILVHDKSLTGPGWNSRAAG